MVWEFTTIKKVLAGQKRVGCHEGFAHWAAVAMGPHTRQHLVLPGADFRHGVRGLLPIFFKSLRNHQFYLFENSLAFCVIHGCKIANHYGPLLTDSLLLVASFYPCSQVVNSTPVRTLCLAKGHFVRVGGKIKTLAKFQDQFVRLFLSAFSTESGGQDQPGAIFFGKIYIH